MLALGEFRDLAFVEIWISSGNKWELDTLLIHGTIGRIKIKLVKRVENSDSRWTS